MALKFSNENVYACISMQLCEHQTSKRGEGMAKKAPLRLAMLGMIPGNGHPYSWSAIVNGFEESALESCPYPIIAGYMSPHRGARVEGATVTHLWTDKPEEAASVAKFARIAHVVERPEDVIGEVDAVIVAVDDGDDHVDRVRPFVEAGLPVLVDKPMATNANDLRVFSNWKRSGARILSSSGLRYAEELDGLQDFSWDWMQVVLSNTWKRYGIHFLEPVYTLTGPGFASVRSFEEGPNHHVWLRHRSGQSLTFSMLAETKLPFGIFHLSGRTGQKVFRFQNTYKAFRRQLESFIEYASTGREAFSFSETVELMVILIAAMESSRRNGAEIELEEFQKSLVL